MNGVWARILLRYVGGALVAKGLLAPDIGAAVSADPDVLSAAQVLLGALVAGAAEFWYALARRFGWAK